MRKKILQRDRLFFSRDHLKRNLKRKTIQSTVVKVGANGTSFLLNITSTIILARLLAPEEFGLLVMVTAVTEFARSFRELGLGAATVQREEINHQQISTLFWINFGIGVLIMVVLMFFSPILALFYDDARLLNMCMVLSVVFFFGGLTVQHRALLERQMRFGSLGAINIISTTISICVAIVLSLHGYGVWALVCRDIVAAASYAAGTWLLCRWIPSLPKRSKGIKSSLRFGMDISGFEIIQYLTRSFDRILIGRFCGAASLGLYSKAFQLAMMPIEQIRIVFWDIAFSPLSALQNNAERFRRFYSRLLSAMTILYVPIVIFLVVQSENVILLILGENWLSAVPIFRVIAIAGFFRPVVGTFQLVMISCGKSRRCVRWGVINGVCLIIAFTIGISWGNIGVAYAYAFASYVSLMWSFVYCFKETPINALFVVKNIAMPIFSGCVAGIILLALMPQLTTMNTGINIISSFLFFSLTYLGILLSIPKGRRTMTEFWSYRTELLARK